MQVFERNLEMIYLYGSHGNETLGGAVAQQLRGTVKSRCAHPEAVAQGERCFGPVEIMSSYPGNPDGNPEEQAAYANLQWLGDRAGDPNVVVLDQHNSDIKNLRFCQGGMRVPRAAVAAAVVLGHTRYVADTCSFLTLCRMALR